MNLRELLRQIASFYYHAPFFWLFFLTLAGAFLAVRFCRPVAALIDTWVAKVGRSALNLNQ